MTTIVSFEELDSFTRSTIDDEVIKDVKNQDPNGEHDEVEGMVIVFNYEINYTYTIVFTEESESFESQCDMHVVEFDVKPLLNSLSLSFSKSSISETVYFELNGSEYRVSTHKRPAVYDESGNWLADHKYENEIICKNEVEMYRAIEKLIEEGR